MQERVDRLLELLDGAGVKAFYVTNQKNCAYLSGFSGTAGALLLCRDHSYLLTDFRYTGQAAIESPGFEIVEIKSPYIEALCELTKVNHLTDLGCEGDNLTYNNFVVFRDRLEEVRLKPLSGLVESLRLCKDDIEVKSVEEAVRLADGAFLQLLPAIRPGVSERELALSLEYTMRRMGADGIAFKIIVASGPRSVLPHGVATAREIREGDLVTFDFGAVYRGYHSDITRTVVIGAPEKKQKEIYRIVLEAQMKAISVVRAGVRASEVDHAARKIIEDSGYGDYFGHSTGHGLGLDIHENPRLSSKDDTVLQTGMVVTVEPGIYLPDWGGVRIEDTILVQDDGCRVLTMAPKGNLLSLS